MIDLIVLRIEFFAGGFEILPKRKQISPKVWNLKMMFAKFGISFFKGYSLVQPFVFGGCMLLVVVQPHPYMETPNQHPFDAFIPADLREDQVPNVFRLFFLHSWKLTGLHPRI